MKKAEKKKINDKYIVIDNQKNLRCNCDWFNDNKAHLRLCNHCLSVLHHISKETYWNEIYEHGIRKKDEKYIGSNYGDC